MRKQYLSTKFSHQEIRWNYGILRSVNNYELFYYYVSFEENYVSFEENCSPVVSQSFIEVVGRIDSR